jgi:ribosome-associated protein
VSSLEAIEVARKAVEVATSKQASNIVLLDTKEACGFADYFVICNGESDRQIKSILEEINTTLKQSGVRSHHSEGNTESGWVLMDFGDVIVHIFNPAEREHYQLDDLWREANKIGRAHV